MSMIPTLGTLVFFPRNQWTSSTDSFEAGGVLYDWFIGEMTYPDLNEAGDQVLLGPMVC